MNLLNKGYLRVMKILFLVVVLYSQLMGSSLYAAEKVVPDNPQPFAEWVHDLKLEALENGISEATFDEAFKGVEPSPRVISMDRSQAKKTQTNAEYIAKRLSPTRIKSGKIKMAENTETLDSVTNELGVQKRFIVSIWGIETNYGSFTGGHNIIKSLVTLSYDQRRSEYFRKELINALKILEEGHVKTADFKGSYDGGMGQGQFMPSSFLVYAYDFDKDGKKDIWNNKPDVFASIANYLKKHGWQAGRTWGRQVTVPKDVDGLWAKVKQTEKITSCRRALKYHSKQLTLAEWQKLGVRAADGGDLPQVADPNFKASLIMVMGHDGPAFLAYDNYRAILSYNCSNLYALSVSLLSEKFK